MKNLIFLVFALFLISPAAKAAVGINAGFGVPFVTQYGLNYTMNDKWGFGLGYNNLSFSIGEADTSLTMPEAVVYWHPFSGSFFVGLGMGQETLEVTASDTVSSAEAKASVTASTTILKLGWMWGKADGGFWFGMDVAYVSPSGGEVDVEIEGVPSDDALLDDVEEAGTRFGETAYTNITIARLGYLF